MLCEWRKREKCTNHQKEPTTYGVPIQVYFFSRNKVWKEYERIQSDIFDHLLVMVQKFDLKLYQYSD